MRRGYGVVSTSSAPVPQLDLDALLNFCSPAARAGARSSAVRTSYPFRAGRSSVPQACLTASASITDSERESFTMPGLSPANGGLFAEPYVHWHSGVRLSTITHLCCPPTSRSQLLVERRKGPQAMTGPTPLIYQVLLRSSDSVRRSATKLAACCGYRVMHRRVIASASAEELAEGRAQANVGHEYVFVAPRVSAADCS